MDWTLPLRVQQADLVKRLNADLIDKTSFGKSLLRSEVSGSFSELTVISGELLEQLRGIIDRELFDNIQSGLPLNNFSIADLITVYSRNKMIELLLKNQFSSHLKIINLFSQNENSISLCLCKNSSVNISLVVSQGDLENIYWVIDREIILKNELIIFLAIDKFFTKKDDEYNLIFTGFLPTNLIENQDEKIKITMSELLYGGGLSAYLEVLSSPSSHAEWEWMRSLAGRSNYTYPVAISNDGKTLVSSSFEGNIKIWQIADGEHLQALSEGSWSSGSDAFRSDGQNINNAINDKMLILSHITDGKLSQVLPGNPNGMSAIAISSDGKFLASGGYDGIVNIWNLENGKQLQSWNAHAETVRLLAIGGNGLMIASTTERIIKVWDLDTGNLLQTLSLNSGTVVSIAMSNDGQSIATGNKDGIINVWDVQTGRVKNTFSAHAGAVRSISFSPDNQTMASSSMEKTIKLWQIENGDLLRTLTGYPDPVVSIAANQNNTISLNLFRHQQPGWSDPRQWH